MTPIGTEIHWSMTPGRENLCMVGDSIVHHDDLSVAWISTLCGLRRTREDQARILLRYTDGAVDCMTCLVLKARRQP